MVRVEGAINAEGIWYAKRSIGFRLKQFQQWWGWTAIPIDPWVVMASRSPVADVIIAEDHRRNVSARGTRFAAGLAPGLWFG